MNPNTAQASCITLSCVHNNAIVTVVMIWERTQINPSISIVYVVANNKQNSRHIMVSLFTE